MTLRKITVAAAEAAAALMLMTMASSDGSLTTSNISREAARPREPIQLYIVEELPVGTLIGSVPTDAMLNRRYDEYQMMMLRYSVVGQKEVESGVTVQLFDVDDVSGIVSTVVQIDRDELCAAKMICVVQLDVLIRPGQFFDVIKFTIEILDMNDHSPNFDDHWSTFGMTLNISESVLPGSSFNLLGAVDKDGVEFGVQRYRLMSADQPADSTALPFHLVFEPRFSDLRLVTSSKLDRERIDRYQMVVVAYDGGDPVKSGSLKVTVKVVDTNDNVPVFERATYEFTVTEDQPPGSVVGKVTATDQDLGINAQLSYRLSPQTDHADVFSIDADTGQIYIRSALDYERNARYHLTVMACDGAARNGLQDDGQKTEPHSSDITTANKVETGGRSLTAYSTVRVHVVDSNDHVPRVSVNTLRSPPDVALLSLDADTDAFVAYVSVADPDTGSSGRVTCSLHEELAPPTHFRLQRLSPTQFQIVTSSPMDGDDKSLRRHLLAVICRDLGEDVSKWSRADIVVDVAPPNDNAPHFQRQIYECDVTADTGSAVDDVVTTVKAIDVDDGVSGQVKYRVDEPFSELFAADSDTGIITTKVTLSREQLASMTFNVIAYDLGVPSRSSTATVRLSVQEDSALTFDKPSYSFVVFENQSPHTEVGQLTASDPVIDLVTSSVTSTIRYDLFREVSEADFDVAFEINATTGKLYTKVVLDRERRAHFRFRVTARGTAVQAVPTMARVSIHVADLNDNRPRVQWPPRHGVINDTTIRLSTGAPTGHVVAVISADDPDEGDNACLSYTIVSGNEDDLFEVVNPSEGRIAVKRSLLSATETWRLFTLHVDVADGGMPPLSTSTVLNIVVDASLPFAPAQNRFVVINNNKTIVLVLSSLSSATIVLLITVVLLLRRFAADQKQDGDDRQTGSGSGGGLGRLGSSPSRLVRTALARYRDRRRRRAKQKRSLAASRDLAVARDFTRSREEELSWLSGPPSELSEGDTAWDLRHANCRRGDIVLAHDDNTSAIVIVNDNTDHQSTSSSFIRV